MPSTYTLISSNVLTSSAASVIFSAIPSTYTDLVIRMSARSDRVSTGNLATFNIKINDATSGYSVTYIVAEGATVSSSRTSNAANIFAGALPVSGTTANTFSSNEIYIPSYTANQNKPFSHSWFVENNDASSLVVVGTEANLYSSTTAISSITLYPSTYNFVSGSSFYLYGIKNS